MLFLEHKRALSNCTSRSSFIGQFSFTFEFFSPPFTLSLLMEQQLHTCWSSLVYLEHLTYFFYLFFPFHFMRFFSHFSTMHLTLISKVCSSFVIANKVFMFLTHLLLSYISIFLSLLAHFLISLHCLKVVSSISFISSLPSISPLRVHVLINFFEIKDRVFCWHVSLFPEVIFIFQYTFFISFLLLCVFSPFSVVPVFLMIPFCLLFTLEWGKFCLGQHFSWELRWWGMAKADSFNLSITLKTCFLTKNTVFSVLGHNIPQVPVIPSHSEDEKEISLHSLFFECSSYYFSTFFAVIFLNQPY